jgi:hypothetical protein
MIERRPFDELAGADGAAIKDVAVVRITAIEDSEVVMVDAP